MYLSGGAHGCAGGDGAAGPIVSHFSWRWIFWVNVPFCLAGLVLAARGLERSVPRQGAYLDLAGLALLSPALAALIYDPRARPAGVV